MEGNWGIGGRDRHHASVAKMMLETLSRTFVVRKALVPSESDAARQSASQASVKCLPTRCDFPV